MRTHVPKLPAIDDIDEQMQVLMHMNEVLESYYLNKTLITREAFKIPTRIRYQPKPLPAKNTKPPARSLNLPKEKENDEITKIEISEIPKMPSISRRTSLTGSGIPILVKSSHEKSSCESCQYPLPKVDKTHKQILKPKAQKYKAPDPGFLHGQWRY